MNQKYVHSFTCLVFFLLITAVSARAVELQLHSRTPGAKPYISERYVYELEWQADHIQRVIAGQEFDFRGGPEMPDIAPKGDPGRVEVREGRSCLVGGFFQFDVDELYLYDTDETVVLNLLFDTSVSDSFVVTYDAAIGPKAVKYQFDRRQGRWQWARLDLERARFANRRHGVDFGIATLASQMAGVKYEEAAMGTGDATSRDRLDADPNIALCKLVMERSEAKSVHAELGTFELQVRDEMGELTAVRIGLYEFNTGWSPKPGKEAIRMRLLGLEQSDFYLIDGQENWPGKNRYVFFVDGNYQADIPAGTYQLIISKGPEYHIVDRKIKIQPTKKTLVRHELKRWKDMQAAGWYSGDIHVHLERRDRGDDDWVLKLADAEDVAVSSMLAESGWYVPHFFANYAYGDELGGRVYSKDKTHVIVSGQESPVTQELGHAIGINQSSPVRSKDYYLYSDYIEGIHNNGGLFGFSHLPYYPLLNVHRGIALEAPFGHVDFVEVLQAGVLGTKVWYDFLNLGFKLTPAAGTDFPFLNMWGTERNYVKIENNFNHQTWYDEFARGHVFVTSGPVLNLDVNGASMGEEIYINEGEQVRIRAEASVNPDLDQIDRLELVVHGGVVATVDKLSRDKNLVLDYTFNPTESLWLAIRAYGQQGNPTEAHSAPVYVYVDGDRFFANKAAVPELVSFYTEQLNQILVSPPSWPDAETRQEFSKEELLHEYHRQLPRLRERVIEVKKIYADLLNKAQQ